MKKKRTWPRRRYLILAGVVCAGLAVVGIERWTRPPTPEQILARWCGAADRSIAITYPLHGTVFPPELPAPTFRWVDSSGADTWVVTAGAEGRQEVSALLSQPRWTPQELQWQRLKSSAAQAHGRALVLGLRRADLSRVVSFGNLGFQTSTDPVGAPIFYREVNLPFVEAVKDPRQIRWRFGPVSSTRPPVVLENLPVCGNCHSFSADGKVLGMDIDYANDKGSYALVPVKSEIVLDSQSVITWADYRREDKDLTFGLLSQVSPDGRYVVSTVKDRSVFVPMPDLAYSQLFFPVKGILVVYDRQSRTFRPLPGADDPAYVQSNPAWSPDGKEIVFARSRAYQLQGVGSETLLRPDQCAEFVQGRRQFHFDLCRVPFNDGAGGAAVPVEGAVDNGMSNYFARFSPDGKWIVFCRAKSFMLLQADSELYIMPAAGGAARRMRCNVGGMNSWHSWSPNSRWLVFASKAGGPYTQLWLAHVDASGASSPPVLLEQFTAVDRAANIPEFVSAGPQAIAAIREQFVNDVSYFRSGNEALMSGDLARAEAAYEKALQINPDNVDVHNNLGNILANTGRGDLALRHLRRVVELDPNYFKAWTSMGAVLENRPGDLGAAIDCYRRSIALNATDPVPHTRLAGCLWRLGDTQGAVAQWRAALKLSPDQVGPRLSLAAALVRGGQAAQAVAELDQALALNPADPKVRDTLAWILATSTDPRVLDGPRAVALAEKACRLSPTLSPYTLDTLAAAYAQAGRFADALAAVEKAIAAARAQRRELVDNLLQRRDCYRANKPWRQE
ncbi:MAG: tetratricopeptide repeat protein [Planctomycetaceae bacterium]|nr:tetratricopeptide repeat protein [Planctomycetaceae bacterium]